MAKMRAYFKLDLYFFEHPKVVDLSAEAIVLYIASIAYCNRRETDGFIARPVVRRLIDVDEQEGRTAWEIADELVKAGLWEEARPGFVQTDTKPRPPDGPDGFWIHDFLEHNESNEERAQRREHDAARKRRERGSDTKGAGHTPNSSRPGNVQSDTTGRPSGQDAASEPVPPIAVAVTEQSNNSKKINTVVEQARPIDDTTAVFQAWQDAARKPRARLDDKRRRRIRAALKHYPLADVLDAVQGWQHSPHHCGQNDTGTVYNDLELLLRDAAHIETFRDLWRDGPPAGPLHKHTRQLLTEDQRLNAWVAQENGSEVNHDHDPSRVGHDRPRAQRELPHPDVAR